ncbi:MAG TPA: LysR family transcriptional regulator [Phenylobacterium sp.]
MPLPLNALQAFEAAARHLNFTRAADELCVTQGAVSHQVRVLEAHLGVRLFDRLPRGVALTDEGLALLPELSRSFALMTGVLDRARAGGAREPIVVGVANTFAVGWLLPRLETFRAHHPGVDVRIRTHNNLVNHAGEGLDCAIQFGDGGWPGLEATRVLDANLAPLCSPTLASRLQHPSELTAMPLLQSYRPDEWPRWFAMAGVDPPRTRGMMFDSSLAMAAAAERSVGVALAPPVMFTAELASGRLVQPFSMTLDAGAYFVTRLASRPATAAMQAFIQWCADAGAPDPGRREVVERR